ncbi:MAG: hypothetical protein KAV41_02735, partial [Candidatus Pacebacteria bacterium]|nr:hypothetical protein [Candidatus Paceibacterota bacterium]
VLSIILNVYYKFYILKNTIRKEIKNVDKNIRKVFKILNHNIITHIKYLKKSKNKAELKEKRKEALKAMQKNFKDAEKLLKAEIKNIRKDLE